MFTKTASSLKSVSPAAGDGFRRRKLRIHNNPATHRQQLHTSTHKCQSCSSFYPQPAQSSAHSQPHFRTLHFDSAHITASQNHAKPSNLSGSWQTLQHCE